MLDGSVVHLVLGFDNDATFSDKTNLKPWTCWSVTSLFHRYKIHNYLKNPRRQVFKTFGLQDGKMKKTTASFVFYFQIGP